MVYSIEITEQEKISTHSTSTSDGQHHYGQKATSLADIEVTRDRSNAKFENRLDGKPKDKFMRDVDEYAARINRASGGD